MVEAVLPFLGYLGLQLVVMTAGLNIVRDKKLNVTVLLKSWIMGQMLLFTVLQILAVPMILLRWRFNALFWTYISIVIVLFALGIRRLTKVQICLKPQKKSFSWLSILLLTLAILIILSQSCTYFFGFHLDEDDARWLAEANDALEYGQMMTRSFSTGEFIGKFMEIRDVISPWPMLFSIISRVLNTRVSIVAHTFYPTIEIFIIYGIYFLIAKELLKKREAQYAFLLFTSIILYFYGGTVYTQGAFSLVRIWQGKASVAAIVIPFILYLSICINKRNQFSDWMKLTMAGTAACLMSGMGISISLLMIGIFGLYHLIAYLHWKRFPAFILSVLPSLVFALIYYLER